MRRSRKKDKEEEGEKIEDEEGVIGRLKEKRRNRDKTSLNRRERSRRRRSIRKMKEEERK